MAERSHSGRRWKLSDSNCRHSCTTMLAEIDCQGALTTLTDFDDAVNRSVARPHRTCVPNQSLTLKLTQEVTNGLSLLDSSFNRYCARRE